ncbi:hypothetical protein QEG98_33705 [Myxococcus sp. MxC21-1]|uniref:hypothetical protein n=1 Tax=Myxococcus TaxID=32 RepID=UPI00292DD6D4|nr:hypothetical protein [Myxococcus sp. MxC21-1]WNZ60845.1 hypothetical protein QEG98_33705 [Myxococcus sp. MxC21-1]
MRSIRARRRDEQLLQQGESAEATVLQVQRTRKRINHSPVFAVRLEVRRSGHAPYEVGLEDRLDAWDIPVMEPGRRLKVKIHPNDAQRVLLVGEDTSQPSSVSPQGDPVKAMADLQRMANEGLIAAEEYEQKRAEILSRL